VFGSGGFFSFTWHQSLSILMTTDSQLVLLITPFSSNTLLFHHGQIKKKY
jgi:hypothetical protein